MKKPLAVFFICISVYALNAQVIWQTDLDQAKKFSASTGKLLVIDFWADWCGPCRTMDMELWKNAEMENLSANFIGVKINVDVDPGTAMTYSVRGIPKVVFAFATGDKILEMTGFSNAEEYLKIIRALPSGLQPLYENMRILTQNEKDPLLNLKTGIEFQNTAKRIRERYLKDKFLSHALFHFHRAGKLSNDSGFRDQTELYAILNDVYRNNPKKALKSFEKAGFDTNDKITAELYHFVLASCYKALQDSSNFEKEKSLVSNEEYLVQLKEE